MWHQQPICLTLILLLAFWTPVGACCHADGTGPVEDASTTDAGEATVQLCHGVPVSNTNEPTEPGPCEDHACDCASHLLGSCQTRTVESKLAPSNPNYQLSWLLSLAPIQPQTLLPHTFFADLLEADDALPPPASAQTLLALNCQLTL